jgi:anti-sigma B factor antagonist
MEIVERTAGSVTVLDLKGKLVLGDGSGRLKDKINSLVFEGKRQILLNLGGVSFVDSSGLGELVAASTTVANRGGQIKLLNLTKRVSDLLVISWLSNVFDSFDSEQEALHSFTAAASKA